MLLTGAPNVKGLDAERLAARGVRVWGMPEEADGSLDLLPGLCRLREEANVYTVLCEGGGGWPAAC